MHRLSQLRVRQKIRVTFITTGLGTGGAEMMLLKLLCGIDGDRFLPSVVSLGDGGTVEYQIQSRGVPLTTIGLKPGTVSLGATKRLLKSLKETRPDVLQGWMTHGNLAASIGGSLLRRPFLWGVRHAALTSDDVGKLTYSLIRGLALISRGPKAIVYNSLSGARFHEKIGYDSHKTLVIPNCFDTDTFCPSEDARRSVREELNLPIDSFLVGIVGRYHPMKDHCNFLKAAGMLKRAVPEVHFILVGKGLDRENDELKQIIDEAGLRENACLLGERQDVPRLTAALDVAVSSSRSEGSPNAVGEAMACGVPCVVTDVGDSALLVGGTGIVVPPGDSDALYKALYRLMYTAREDRRRMGVEARQLIIGQNSIDVVVRRFEAAYLAAAAL